MITLEQKRAKDALDKVQEITRNSSDEFKNSYRSYVERIGSTILVNGLGQALATELAAGGENPEKDDEKAHKKLYDNIQSWLCREDKDHPGVYQPGNELLKCITENDETFYLQAQAEALKWLEWHKKFCQAYLPRKSGSEE